MSIIREYIRKKYYFRLNKRLYADGNMIILFPSAFFIRKHSKKYTLHALWFDCNFAPHNVSILRNTHCMPYGLIVILPPHNNQTELQ